MSCDPMYIFMLMLTIDLGNKGREAVHYLLKIANPTAYSLHSSDIFFFFGELSIMRITEISLCQLSEMFFFHPDSKALFGVYEIVKYYCVFMDHSISVSIL